MLKPRYRHMTGAAGMTTLLEFVALVRPWCAVTARRIGSPANSSTLNRGSIWSLQAPGPRHDRAPAERRERTHQSTNPHGLAADIVSQGEALLQPQSLSAFRRCKRSCCCVYGKTRWLRTDVARGHLFLLS